MVMGDAGAIKGYDRRRVDMSNAPLHMTKYNDSIE